MRRIPAFLGAAAVLAPMLLSTATPASAASGSLTVTTLGRDGKAVATSPQAVNLTTHESFPFSSGKAHTLPNGRYAVLVDVWNTRDSTDTLGAKILTVSGPTRTTIDARQGRSIRISLDRSPGTGYEQDLSASLCVPGTGESVFAWSSPGRLFVIPNSSSAVGLAYVSSWTKSYGAGPVDRYLTLGLSNKGLPKGVSSVVRRSSLANVTAQVRSGPMASSDAEVQFSVRAGDGTCANDLQVPGQSYTLPYTLTTHLTPGSWNTALWSPSDYNYNNNRTFKAGASYSLLFNRSAWGPAGSLPFTWGYGHRLYVDPDDMFVDPSVAHSGSAGRTTVTLTKSGKTVAKGTYTEYGNGPGTFNPVLKSAGWYSLNLSAKRYHPDVRFPAGMLSPASTVSMHFYADPAKNTQIPLFLTQFLPTALDSANRARPGSTTTVNLRLYRPRPDEPEVSYPKDGVRTVQAWASTDGGKTWHSVKVKHSGGNWTALVPNPGSGAVSLRASVLDTHSNRATVTVYRAYAIG